MFIPLTADFKKKEKMSASILSHLSHDIPTFNQGHKTVISFLFYMFLYMLTNSYDRRKHLYPPYLILLIFSSTQTLNTPGEAGISY